ncbi:MAG: protein KTI12 [Piptocephalis tieghemiana]|nr:MAG: protein KTI12 [Piptocephalis tieghemiana]
MPLITLCGFPCSGKSRRADQLAKYLRDKGLTVQVLNDAGMSLSRSVYDAGAAEKRARGNVLSTVERHLDRQTVVLVDGMNYVKGFRYQLFCLARAMSTQHCVVQCGVPVEQARAWNASRPVEDAYPAEQFDSLVMRFEEPDGSRRWDAPLFTVLPEDETPPLEEIYEVLTQTKASTAKLATLVQPVGTSNDIHDGDRVTQRIVDAIMMRINDTGGGSISTQGIEVPGTTIKVMIPADGCTLAEIRRLRRQFLKLSAGRVQGSRQGTVATLFVEYINTNLH